MTKGLALLLAAMMIAPHGGVAFAANSVVAQKGKQFNPRVLNIKVGDTPRSFRTVRASYACDDGGQKNTDSVAMKQTPRAVGIEASRSGAHPSICSSSVNNST